MDPTRFTDQKSGQIVRVSLPPDDWAFVPNPLMPKDWKFPEQLWPLLAKAKERLGTLNGLGFNLPNAELLLRPLQNREALRSSSLEGTYASAEELMLFSMEPHVPKSKDDPANSWLEVFNYTRSLAVGLKDLDSRPFSLNLLKLMHNNLLLGVRGKEMALGEFRKNQNLIGSDRRYIPPPVPYLDDLLQNLQTAMNVDSPNIDPLIRAYIVHYQFEAIHPFMDGNGRVGRVLLALMIFKACEHRMPWLYMSAFFDRYKEEYIDKLFRVSTHGAWTDWLDFCLRGTIVQADDAIRRCELLLALRKHYSNTIGMSSPRIHPLIERLFSQPMVRVVEVTKSLKVSYPTARKDISVLERAGVLKQLPNTFPATFFATEIFDVAYNDEIVIPPSLAPLPTVLSKTSSNPIVALPPVSQSPPAASDTTLQD